MITYFTIHPKRQTKREEQIRDGKEVSPWERPMKMKRVRFHGSSRAIDYDVNTQIRIHCFGPYIKANRETHENPGSVSTVTVTC